MGCPWQPEASKTDFAPTLPAVVFAGGLRRCGANELFIVSFRLPGTHGRTMATARAIREAAVTPSSTRHDWGGEQRRQPACAKTGMAVNHSALAKGPASGKGRPPHVG